MDPFAIQNQAQISASAVRRVHRGHLWIYKGELEREPADADSVIVQVIDSSGNILGYGFYSRQSQIRLRLFSHGHEPPSPDLFRTRIKKSLARRKGTPGAASASRLIFAESDLLPGIIVDRYGDYLVVQTLTRGAERIKSLLVEILGEELKPEGILERNDVKARLLEGLAETRGVLWGTVPEEIEIEEDGIRFIIDLLRGQKTGFFLDQSENRIAAKKYASGTALDCFSNTGAFALQFARQCDSVVAVDISSEAILLARRNSQLNAIPNVDFAVGNVFDFLRELKGAGLSFNTVCLDPPAFAKNRKAVPGARSGYKEINLRAMKLLKPEGILVTSSCSYHMSESDFFELLCDAAHDCHRFIQVLERRGQASDHPSLAGMPETRYLKCFILRVL